ncbi:TonB-dependent receptor [Brevundimonas sp. LM2]|uniref:TonB-dependent receptor n=1 Tax=Brevundimonas sp. LM2 TaxID=1938605 RepID=UPI000983FA7B|nr:TonB-dependent receptor [Brevundimonas sp. LM2]AQR61313.1 TonB-dependent receptor [Brevundimonas sp. LM2]
MSKPNAAGPIRPKLKPILLATVSVMVAGGGVTAASAQDAPVTDLDEVVVTGFRRSLGDARDIKQDSVIAVDAIVAEDMAKFPDLNLAESLQRLPGVQITREAGEGRRISLRGLGADFSRVQLNGMEVLGNVDSAQDSRGQRSRDRAFDFNIFASELFSRVEVEKTFQASQKEGGMAGTVGLFTGRPFDAEPGFRGAVTTKVGTNEYTDDAQPRVAALISQNWDNVFGVSLSAAYSHRETTEQGHNTYNFARPNAATLQSLVTRGLNISRLSAAEQAKFVSGDLYFADGNRISSWNAEQERLGLTAAVQWRPTSTMELTLDVLHGEFTTERNELHLATRPLNSTGSVAFDTAANATWPSVFRTASIVNDIAWDANNYVTMTDVTGTTFGSEHRRSRNENEFNQIVLTGKWDLSDRLTLDGHVGYEKSTYETPYDDKLYMRAKGNLIANYGADGRSATFEYPGFDATNPANYAMDSFYYRGFHNESELHEGELNGRFLLNDTWTLSAGVAYHKFRQDGRDTFYDDNVNGTRTKTRGTSVADIADVYTNEFGSWLVGNYDRAFAKYNEYHRFGPNKDGTGGALQDIENVFETTEETVSGFVQADWDSEVMGKRFRGNIGLRGYSTDTRSVGWIQGDSYAYLGTSDVEGGYEGVLPALNTVLDIADDVLLRFSATQNLNRPGLGSMAAEGSAFASGDHCDPSLPDGAPLPGGFVNDCEITASRGNPNLEPYKVNAYDLGLEYYFGDVGLFALSVFQKDITNYIDSVNLENVPFSETGVPFSTIPGATAGTIVDEFSMPINREGSNTLTGLELTMQAQLTFLPAPFDGFGVTANYTKVEADEALTGFSPESYNATVYYETTRWGARASMSHRDTWFSGYNDDPMNAGTRGFEASTYVDAAAFINLAEGLQLTFDAVNLTNEKDTQFWGESQYLYNQNQSGTTYMAGLSYTF